MLVVIFISVFLFLINTLSSDYRVSLGATSVLLLFYFIRSYNLKRHLSQDGVFLIAFLCFAILFIYALRFEPTFVYFVGGTRLNMNNSYFVDETVSFGCIIVQAMLLGGAFFLSGGRLASNLAPPVRQLTSNSTNTLLLIAWIPLPVAAAVYLFFFKGGNYVDIHTAGGATVPNVLAKFIFVHYGAVLILGQYAYPSRTLVLNIVGLMIATSAIYLGLYQWRTPVLTFILLATYLWGKQWPFAAYISGVLLLPVIFAVIALLRDQTLGGGSGTENIVDQILDLGDFANAIPFAQMLYEKEGPQFAIPQLLGLTEPLSWRYSQELSLDVFLSGGGFGFFFPADLLANFGSIGAVVSATIFGGFLSYIRHSKSIFLHSISVYIFASAFLIVRNDSSSAFRGVFYFAAATMVVSLFAKFVGFGKARSKILNVNYLEHHRHVRSKSDMKRILPK